MSYDRIVSAALAETSSKFALAEALALEIPPRVQGAGATTAGTRPVTEYLAEARQAIITAGGEVREVQTLSDYRKTALWVMGEKGDVPLFRWVAGLSYSAHDTARKTGMTVAEFAAMPKGTVDAVRDRAGLTGTRGHPEAIAQSWTPEQRADVARELLTDPAVADAVAEDPSAASHAQEAIWRHRGRANYPKPAPKRDHAETDLGLALMELLARFVQTRKNVDYILGMIQIHRDQFGGGVRSDVLAQADYLANAAVLIRDALQGESVDEAITALLTEGN